MRLSGFSRKSLDSGDDAFEKLNRTIVRYLMFGTLSLIATAIAMTLLVWRYPAHFGWLLGRMLHP